METGNINLQENTKHTCHKTHDENRNSFSGICQNYKRIENVTSGNQKYNTK